MKKLAMVLGVVALFAGTTSCKKDFVCECTDSGLSYTITFKESKKAAAAAEKNGGGRSAVDIAREEALKRAEASKKSKKKKTIAFE